MAKMAKRAKIDYNIYMADGTLVRDIYISNVPQDILVEDVQKYFLQFGEVAKVKLQLEGPAELVGYINFVEPLAAAKALLKKDHIILPYQRRITAEACGMWYTQPSILCLIDDCLLEICKHLGLADQMSLAQTHSRCAALIYMSEKSNHTSVDLKELSELLTSCQVEEFFRLFGSTVEEIYADTNGEENCDIFRDDIVDSMKTYCSNVKFLQLYNCNLHGRLSELLLRMQQITQLSLYCCSLMDEEIPHMPNLMTFKCLNHHIKGEFLGRLTTVQHLNLDNCNNIQPHILIDAIKSMNMLQSLHLDCDNVTSDILQEITKSCHKLEVLIIGFRRDVEYECLAQLESLKVLEFFYENEETPMTYDKLLKALVKYKAHQLEYLGGEDWVGPEEAVQLGLFEQLKYLVCIGSSKLNDNCLREFAKLRYLQDLDVSFCDELTADGLLNLLGECTKLMRLNIAGCETITNAFVYQAIDILAETAADRNGPVEMDVCMTGISETILKEAQYIRATSLLLLHVHECDINWIQFYGEW